jgi:hypothetical protein
MNSPSESYAEIGRDRLRTRPADVVREFDYAEIGGDRLRTSPADVVREFDFRPELEIPNQKVTQD